jgi:hypothetical protein
MEKDVRKFEKDAVQAAREYKNREFVLPIPLLFLTTISKIFLVL